MQAFVSLSIMGVKEKKKKRMKILFLGFILSMDLKTSLERRNVFKRIMNSMILVDNISSYCSKQPYNIRNIYVSKFCNNLT